MSAAAFLAIAVGTVVVILLAMRYELRREDGPPDPPSGDMPHVPDEARR